MDRILWEPTLLTARDGTEQPAEKGEIKVPEDRTRGKGEISLRFVRIKSTEPKGPPAIFLSGGPGDSGIQWSSHGPFLKVFQRVSRHVDVILLDQRGTGSSERDLSMEMPSLLPDDFASKDHMVVLLGRDVAKAAARHRKQGAPLKAYNVIESAKDLMDLREALGVEKVSLWGYSYGTHLTQMACRLMPAQIERVVLCGFEGPDQTFKLPHNMDAQIARIDMLSPGFEENLGMAIRKLQDHPVEVNGVRFGSFALKHMVASWCGLSNRFTRLPSIAASLAAGNGEVLARNMKDYLRLWARPLTFYMTDAASGATKTRWKLIRDQEPFSILAEATNFPFPDVYPMIEPEDIGDEMRRPLRSSLPMLVFTGSLDGFTPTENAASSLKDLPEAWHVSIENAAHNDLLASPEGVEWIAEFLASGVHLGIEELRIEPPPFR